MTIELKKRILSTLIMIPLSIFFIIKGSFFFIFFLSSIFFGTIYEWHNITKEKILHKFLGIVFLALSFYSAFYFRENYGLVFFMFIIVICISTDIGGYIFGKIFNGPKLTKISPKKTYAGMIGSFILAIVTGYSYVKFTSEIEISQLEILLSIFFISFISQIGDLLISYFKRKAKIKHTSNIIPGHGGLLDRIDGLIFVFLILYLFNFISI